MKDILRIVVLALCAISATGCVGKSHSLLPKKSIQEAIESNKSLLVLQTTMISPRFMKCAVDSTWINLEYPHNAITIKNYSWVYIIGMNESYPRIDKIGVYIVDPGTYTLKIITDYCSGKLLPHIRTYPKNDINFKIKADEVLYLGNITIDLKNYKKRTKNFFTKALAINNDICVAQDYLGKNYPYLLDKLNIRLLQVK